MDKLYNWFAGKPHRGDDVTGRLGNDILSIGVYMSDPGEQAYYTTKKWSFDFLDKKGVQKPSVTPTDRSTALYYYKQALRFGDLPAAERYLKKYKKLGGNLRSMRASIKLSHPLGGVPRRMRGIFLRSLTDRERETYDRARKWYTDTYLPRRRPRKKGAST